MSSTDHQRASDLFVEARRLPLSERPAFLERACGGDAALRAEVESLLGHDSDQSGFLNTPALGEKFDLAGSGIPPNHARGQPADQPPAAMPKRIASYRILEVLGEGGMGVVYLAEQDKPRRQVALKVLKTGMTTPAMARRFEYEAHILGRLQHAGIAQIYEAGVADEGRGRMAFFAMEFVGGRELGEHVESQRLDPRERMRLIARICDAVQFAHLKGVIHRDLKPANILVDPSGQPKILDFGVARATNADIQATAVVTDVGQLVGTLPYMSPEQVAGDPAELDTRSDVYALGVILYELLAGQPPYDLSKTSVHEAARMIREKEPARLGSLDRAFRGDIETLVAKALEKDKQRRYQSASDFAADILRFLSDEPIIARPASRVYQLRKFARRNKGLVGGVAAAVVMLIAGVVAASALALKEAEQRRLAETSAKEARLSAELARVNEQKASEVSAYLRELFRGGMDPLVAGREVLLSDVVDVAARNMSARFADQPEVEADLRNEFGSVYYGLGMLDRTEPQYVKALELRREHLGDRNSATLDSVNNLGQLRMSQGRLDDAEALLREALDGRRAVLGPDNVKTLATQSNLCMVLEMLGRLDAAESLMRATLAAQLRSLGEDHNDTLTTMANLSGLMRRRGRHAEAEQLIRRAYEGLKRVHGADHPTTLMALDGLAKSLKKRKKYEEAEPLYREEIAGLRRVLGDEHRDTLIAKANLAALLRHTKKLDEAETLFQQAYSGFRHTLGDDDPTTLRVGEMLADLLRDRRNWARAEFVMREVADSYKRLYGDEHAETLAALTHVGRSMAMQRKYAEAEPVLRQVLEARRDTLGPTAALTLESIRYLVGVIDEQDKLDEAQSLCAELVALAGKTLPPDDWHLACYQGEYGDILDRNGKFDSAEKNLRAAVDGFTHSRGAKHPQTVAAIRRLIRFYESRNKPELVAQFTARLESAKSDGDSGDP